MPSLIVVAGPMSGDYYPLARRPVVIGRDEACPIQIVDDQVSRKHVQIRVDEASGRYIATDMKSANGLFINGRQISGECELMDGDTLDIGKSKLAFFDQVFPDRESAWNHYHTRGQRGRSTLERHPR